MSKFIEVSLPGEDEKVLINLAYVSHIERFEIAIEEVFTKIHFGAGTKKRPSACFICKNKLCGNSGGVRAC